MEKLKRKLNIGALGLVAFSMTIAGTNAVALKFASNTMNPLVFGSLRATAIGLILFLFVGNYKKILTLANIRRIFPGVILLVLFIGFHALGVSQSGALKASIYSLTIPVFVYIFAVTLLHEPLIKRIFFGGLLTLFGSAMMIGVPVILGQSIVLSDMFLLAAYAFLAGAVVHGKYMFKWLTPNELLSVRFLMSGIILLGFTLYFYEPGAFIVGSGAAWLVLLYAITISGVVSNTLYYRGLVKLKAEQTAPLYYIDPMAGTILASFLLGEQLELAAAFGVAVIVAGVFISYPHHHIVLHNYHHPHSNRIKRILSKLTHPFSR